MNSRISTNPLDGDSNNKGEEVTIDKKVLLVFSNGLIIKNTGLTSSSTTAQYCSEEESIMNAVKIYSTNPKEYELYEVKNTWVGNTSVQELLNVITEGYSYYMELYLTDSPDTKIIECGDYSHIMTKLGELRQKQGKTNVECKATHLSVFNGNKPVINIWNFIQKDKKKYRPTNREHVQKIDPNEESTNDFTSKETSPGTEFTATVYVNETSFNNYISGDKPVALEFRYESSPSYPVKIEVKGKYFHKIGDKYKVLLGKK